MSKRPRNSSEPHNPIDVSWFQNSNICRRINMDSVLEDGEDMLPAVIYLNTSISYCSLWYESPIDNPPKLDL